MEKYPAHKDNDDPLWIPAYIVSHLPTPPKHSHCFCFGDERNKVDRVEVTTTNPRISDSSTCQFPVGRLLRT